MVRVSNSSFVLMLYKVGFMRVAVYCLVIVWIIAGCSENTLLRSTDSARAKDFSNYQYLSQVLNSLGGLQVEGRHPNVKVYMRGQGSVMLNTQPLYVIDGIPLGNDYGRAANAVNVQNIASVSVLSGTQATIRYGDLANHGAILIRSKTNKEN
jgi:hypothetical protein